MTPSSTVLDKILSFIGWYFGLATVFAAIVLASLASIPLLFIACIVTPPIGKFIDGKITLSLYQKTGLIFALIMTFAFLAGIDRSQELEIEQARQAQLQNQLQEKNNIAYFNANSSKILANVKKAIKATKYEEAVALSSKYLKADNKELSALHDKANGELTSIHNKQIAKEKAEKLKQEQALIVASQPKAQIANGLFHEGSHGNLAMTDEIDSLVDKKLVFSVMNGKKQVNKVVIKNGFLIVNPWGNGQLENYSTPSENCIGFTKNGGTTFGTQQFLICKAAEDTVFKTVRYDSNNNISFKVAEGDIYYRESSDMVSFGTPIYLRLKYAGN
jgi:hypothetical protein